MSVDNTSIQALLATSVKAGRAPPEPDTRSGPTPSGMSRSRASRPGSTAHRTPGSPKRTGAASVTSSRPRPSPRHGGAAPMRHGATSPFCPSSPGCRKPCVTCLSEWSFRRAERKLQHRDDKRSPGSVGPEGLHVRSSVDIGRRADCGSLFAYGGLRIDRQTSASRATPATRCRPRLSPTSSPGSPAPPELVRNEATVTPLDEQGWP
jgi:hypothetical protein